jgi:hypothetical protein
MWAHKARRSPEALASAWVLNDLARRAHGWFLGFFKVAAWPILGAACRLGVSDPRRGNIPCCFCVIVLRLRVS